MHVKCDKKFLVFQIVKNWKKNQFELKYFLQINNLKLYLTLLLMNKILYFIIYYKIV